MTLQKNILLLAITSIYMFTNLNCMNKEEQELDLLAKKRDFYESNIARNTLQSKLDEEKHSHTYIGTTAAIQVATQVATNKIDQGIDYGLRFLSGDLKEETALKAKNKLDEEEARAALKLKEKKEQEHLDAQINSQKSQDIFQKIRNIREEMEAIDRFEQQGIYDRTVAKNKYTILAKELEVLTQHLKQGDEESKVTDPVEPKKPNSSTENKDKPNKDGLFSSLVAYYGLATVAAGTAADNLAYYSFKNITDLDCFKGSFIDTHSKGINQALVAVTLTALAYKTYSLYKAYKAEKSAQDEDIFNDDLE